MVRMNKGQIAPFLFRDTRIAVGFIGIILSVVLHELFHIAMHWGNVVNISVFPNSNTIVEVTSLTTHYYNTDLEELIAYTITLATLLVTTIIICKIHDAKDTRSFSNTLLPRSSSMRDLSDAQVIELAYKTGIFK